MGFSATDIIEATEKALNSETPEIKEFTGKVVDVGNIVIDTVKTVLLPIVAVNYYAKKAEVYFKDSFEKDILERTKNIPTENIRLPKGNISKNAMNNLAMVLDQQNLWMTGKMIHYIQHLLIPLINLLKKARDYL